MKQLVKLSLVCSLTLILSGNALATGSGKQRPPAAKNAQTVDVVFNWFKPLKS